MILCLNNNYLNAQIGINQKSPKSTLDVVGSPADNTKLDGILTPQITLEQLNNKLNYTVDHKGLLLYITDVFLSVSPRPTRFKEVSTPGYYIFNGEEWFAMESKTGSIYFSAAFDNAANSTPNYVTPNNVFSAIPFSPNDIIINKGDGEWNSNKFKIPMKGAYLIKANLEIKQNTTPIRDIYISVDKVPTPPDEVIVTPFGLWKVSTTGNFTMDYSRVYYLDKDDEIAWYIFSNSTNNLEISSAKLDIFIIASD